MSAAPLLTILIPTRNREAKLGEALASLVRAIQQADCAGKVVVTCVDNYSRDATRSVVEQFAAASAFVEYRHQDRECRTAEESLQNALQYARGDYVWSFGDDDQAREMALTRLLPVLEGQAPDFVLLNLVALADGATRGYFEAPYPTIHYARGLDLFRDFGLVSATTTISRLCFRRAALSVAEWQRLSGISPIYSHSVAMMLAFHDRSAVVIPDPVVVYTTNTLSEEYDRITRVATERRQLTRYSFTVGLIRLLIEASSRLGLPLEAFHTFEEIELSKSSWQAKNSLLGFFIGRMVLDQVSLDLEGGRPEDRFSHDQRRMVQDFFERSPYPGLKSAVFAALRLDLAEANAPRKKYVRELIADLHGGLNGYEDAAFMVDQLNVGLPGTARHSAVLYPAGQPFKFARGAPGNADGRPQFGRHDGLALTVLIPSYNRARNLARQLRGLSEVGIGLANDVEVLVAVNSSTDRTCAVVRAATRMLPNLRVLNYAEFVDSAEENVNRSISEARGCYVWLLGDDDEIVVPTLLLLLNLLRTGEGADAYVFNQLNSKEFQADSNISRQHLIYSFELPGTVQEASALVDCDYRQLVRQHGLTTVMAFLSCHVIRKDVYVDSADYIAVSKIYSHVFGFMRALAGKRTVFVNYPLVARKSSVVIERFRNLTRRARQPLYWPWVIGLVRLARAAARDGVVAPTFLADVWETHPDGRQFRLIDEMYLQLLRQVRHYIDTGDSAQLFTVADMNEFFDYLSTVASKEGIPYEAVLGLHSRLDGIRQMQIVKQLSGADIRPRLIPLVARIADLEARLFNRQVAISGSGVGDKFVFTAARYVRRNPVFYRAGLWVLSVKLFKLGERLRQAYLRVEHFGRRP